MKSNMYMLTKNITIFKVKVLLDTIKPLKSGIYIGNKKE